MLFLMSHDKDLREDPSSWINMCSYILPLHTLFCIITFIISCSIPVPCLSCMSPGKCMIQTMAKLWSDSPWPGVQITHLLIERSTPHSRCWLTSAQFLWVFFGNTYLMKNAHRVAFNWHLAHTTTKLWSFDICSGNIHHTTLRRHLHWKQVGSRLLH